MIDTAEGRDRMIVENWQQLAAAAWRGYQEAGRGAVLLDLKSATNAPTFQGVTVEGNYQPTDPEDLFAQTSDVVDSEGLRDIARYVRNYDPEREIVILIVSGDGDCVRCRCLHYESYELRDPPQAFLQEGLASELVS